MRIFLMGLAMVFVMTGCVTHRYKATPSLVPPTASLLKIGTNITKTKQAIKNVKVTDVESQKQLNQANEALSQAEHEIQKLNDKIEDVIDVAERNYHSYLEQVKENDKLLKKVKTASRENWFWRLTFVGMILFVTRKWWLRLLGIGL